MSYSEHQIADLSAQVARLIEEHQAKPSLILLPHQVPPPGDEWRGWLMFGGRGSGKTFGATKYLLDHVHGPPCLPGPIPHWLGIVAPTLGDAATSCYAGPSGIHSLDPTAQLRQKPGGLIISWPNGSQAKLFGAREPDDIERLRSGGNTSLPTGTLIRTVLGNVPIEQVRIGDLVWTEEGPRPVVATQDHGNKPTLEMRLESGKSVRMTADHKVWTDEQGWIRCDQIRPGMTVTAWSGTGTGGSDLAPTGPGRRKFPSQSGQSCSIVPSTSATTDQSPMGTTSTTSTMTRTITIPTTSPSRFPRIISPSIHAPLNGMLQEGVWQNVIPWDRDLASSAEPSSRTSASPSSAPSSVSVRTRESRLRGSDYSHASCAEAISRAPRTHHKPSLVPDRVVTVLPGKTDEHVWDLTVAGEHDFFANDILLANCLVWLEELAAFRYAQEAFDQVRFGLRIGPKPRWIASTTPKPKPLIKDLAVGNKYRAVSVTHATMYQNPYLDPQVRLDLEEAYKGTTIGSQELFGLLIEQDENALWNREMIERNRIKIPPDMQKIVVGLDPSGGRGEQGIVVVGMTRLPEEDEHGVSRMMKHGYVLDDRTVKLKPNGWGRAAVQAAVDWDADCIVVETNFGGDMAVSTVVTAAEDMGVLIAVRTVHASRGKSPRAQPVATLSAQDRFHWVGTFDDLESQCCTWVPGSDESPDRVDSMVWGCWYMKLVSTVFKSVGTFGGRQVVGRTLGRRRSA